MIKWNPETRRHYTDYLPQLFAAEVGRDINGDSLFRINGFDELLTSDQALRIIRVADLDLDFARRNDWDIVFGTREQVPHIDALWALLEGTADTTGYWAYQLVLHFRELWPSDLDADLGTWRR